MLVRTYFEQPTCLLSQGSRRNISHSGALRHPFGAVDLVTVLLGLPRELQLVSSLQIRLLGFGSDLMTVSGPETRNDGPAARRDLGGQML